MSASINRKYIAEVDHLRAGAALLIFFYHGLHIFSVPMIYGVPTDPLKYWLTTSNPLFAVLVEGHSAVGLFIVLSGFILSIGSVGNTIDYRKFLIARILRIYPLYIVLLFYAIHSYPQATLTTFIVSLLPTANIPAAGAVNGSFGAMFWAVSIEVQCYLIFPFLIAFSNEKGSRFLFGVVLLAFLFCCIAVLATGVDPQPLNYSTIGGRVGQFCLGMVAARFYMLRLGQARLNPAWLGAAALLIIFALFLYNRAGGWPSHAYWKLAWPPVEGAMWAFFIVCYVSTHGLIRGWLSRLLARIGEISYSIYLVHFAILAIIARFALYVRITGNGYFDALFTTLFIAAPPTIALSFLTYRLIEEPFLKRRPKYIISRS